MATHTRKLEFEHGGTSFVGEVVVPGAAGAGPFPVVLVMSNVLGLGPQARNAAVLLAERGMIAVCTDMYGGGAFDADPARPGRLYRALMEDRVTLRARAGAWLDAAKALPECDGRAAAIGYCFGGACVVELARGGADLLAAVSFHGILDTPLPAEPGAVKATVAIYAGAGDPYAPPAQTEECARELAYAGARYSITVFGDAMHGFTDPDAMHGVPGIGYNAMAHAVSWAGTLALLDQVFGKK
jgi:dienelactone hydrolase